MLEQTVALNADLGESFGAYVMGNDAALLPLVQSANVACGFHAGDPVVIEDTLKLAKRHGVSVGAHPGYADLQGFGRRPQHLPLKDVEALVAYQIGALMGLGARVGHAITHVKPHGALNNQACEDAALADAIVRAIASVDARLILVAPVLSQLERAGQEAGLRVAGEIFADRAYTDQGMLVNRNQPGAMIHDPHQAAQHVLTMLKTRAIHPLVQPGQADKAPLPCNPCTVCVHGDGPQALQIASTVRKAILDAGFQLSSLDKFI